MKRLSLSLLAVGLISLGLVIQATAGHGNSKKVLKFHTMAPVVDPWTGTTNPIRGIPGGGLPWSIKRADGELRADGSLSIRVRGLIVTALGNNPVDMFRGVVNCLTPSSPTMGVNASTRPFHASMAGNARISTKVMLPKPCVAPIVFVTSGTGPAPGSWFAATGIG